MADATGGVSNHDDLSGVSSDDHHHHETGQESVSRSNTASDDTWGTSTVETISVTFNTAFSSTPRIAVGPHSKMARGLASYNNPSTTGFDFEFTTFVSTAASGSEPVDWLASEQSL